MRSLAPNGWGPRHAVGKVWPWCADWFSPTHHADTPATAQVPSQRGLDPLEQVDLAGRSEVATLQAVLAGRLLRN